MSAVNPRFDLAGKVVVITGGGKGIGKVYAREFARVGARVVAADIDGEAAKAVAAEAGKDGGEALGLATDIADQASVEALARGTIQRFGGVDVLINNASLMSALARRSWLEIPVDEWDRVMAVNLRGMFLCCRAFVPAMRDKGYGKIVNISSTTAYIGPPLLLHYVASKGAVVAMTKALAKELGDYGVRVTALTPGMTFTEATKNILPDPIMGDMFMEMQALKEKMQPEHVVPALLFLCSEESDFVVGQNWVVDGGMALQ
jgi:3-oxoacyl-[acyl-carrier protein] reductase